jgi:hypothetical protein
MRFACWITGYTHTHSEYAIVSSFPLQQWLHDSAAVSRCSTLPALYCPVPQAVLAQFLTLRHGRLLAHPFQFALHRPSYHSELLIGKHHPWSCSHRGGGGGGEARGVVPAHLQPQRYGGGGGEGSWLTQHPCRFTSGKETQRALARRVGGTGGQSGRAGKTSSTPEFDPRTVQPVASR